MLCPHLGDLTSRVRVKTNAATWTWHFSFSGTTAGRRMSARQNCALPPCPHCLLVVFDSERGRTQHAKSCIGNPNRVLRNCGASKRLQRPWTSLGMPSGVRRSASPGNPGTGPASCPYDNLVDPPSPSLPEASAFAYEVQQRRAAGDGVAERVQLAVAPMVPIAISDVLSLSAMRNAIALSSRELIFPSPSPPRFPPVSAPLPFTSAIDSLTPLERALAYQLVQFPTSDHALCGWLGRERPPSARSSSCSGQSSAPSCSSPPP